MLINQNEIVDYNENFTQLLEHNIDTLKVTIYIPFILNNTFN
jgi:hypothetical protein